MKIIPLFIAVTLVSSLPAQQIELVSVSPSGVQANAKSERPFVSADGSIVVFQSSASNLVAGDLNFVADIFCFNRATLALDLVTASTTGGLANGPSERPICSADGRYIVFASDASNLVVGDTNLARDVFLTDTLLGTTTLISKTTAGIQGNGFSTRPDMSADGRYIVFRSGATNLDGLDLNGIVDDVFLHDTVTGVTEMVSRDSLGVQGNAASDRPCISDDGNIISFWSDSSNLVVGDLNFVRDIFVIDRLAGTTSLASVSSAGVQGNAISSRPAVSGDGRFVAYRSTASNLVAGDVNLVGDVFMHEIATGATTLISKSTAGVQGDALSSIPQMNYDASIVVYRSDATTLDLSDINLTEDVFRYEVATGTTTLISRTTNGGLGNGKSSRPTISADGSIVAFQSHADNMVASDTNLVLDAFFWDESAVPPPSGDPIDLVGPSSALPGTSLNYNWIGATPNSNFYFLYSFSKNGFVYNGHQFELSAPTVISQGSNSALGAGSWTSPLLPLSMAGRTIYFEVAAISAGVIEDSNAVTLNVL